MSDLVPDKLDDQNPQDSTGFPLNRLVAFLGPHIAWLAGMLATWLVTHFPGLNLDGDATADNIAQVLTFLLVTGITYAGQHKWLDGYSKWERGVVADTPGDQSATMFGPAGFPDAPDFEDVTDEADQPGAGEGPTRGMPLGYQIDPGRE